MQFEMKMKLFRAILVAGLSLSVARSMAGQQTPQPTQAAPRPRRSTAKSAPKNAHKVWSNDNIAALRTPEDKYLEAEQASPASQPAAPAASPARSSPAKPSAQPSTIKLPETIEKTEQAIRENTQDIHDAEDRLRQLESELTATPEPQKTQKQAEIKRNEKLIEDAEADVKILQDHVQKLRAPQSGNRTPSPK